MELAPLPLPRLVSLLLSMARLTRVPSAVALDHLRELWGGLRHPKQRTQATLVKLLRQARDLEERTCPGDMEQLFRMSMLLAITAVQLAHLARMGGWPGSADDR